jgi:phage terminase large subunit-like protein
MRLGRFGAKPEVTRVLVDLCKELHRLPAAVRREALLTLSPETQRAIEALRYEWYLWAFPEQLPPPGDWRWWMLAGGRGGGKTRTASEQVMEWADLEPGTRFCLLAKDAGSYRRIMLMGKSGLITISPPWFKARWHKSDKLVSFPNDVVCELHSSEEPQTLRGPEYHRAWVTELFHYAIPKGEREPTAWREGIKLGLRLGQHPKGIIDSSPRQTEFCANLLLGPEDRTGTRPVTQEQIDAGEWSIEHTVTNAEGEEFSYSVVVRRWSSEKNAPNLAPGVIAEWRHDLRGTALEEQELDGKILVKLKGAIFDQDVIDVHSVRGVPTTIVRTMIAVDPTRSQSPTDEAGIMVGGIGADGHAYVWDDCSLRGSPDKWAREALAAHSKYGAHGLVYEANRMPQATKDTVRATAQAIADKAYQDALIEWEERGRKGPVPVRVVTNVKWREVQATENKQTRAEPVSALYEQGRVHHVRDPKTPDRLRALESEMVNWNPKLRMPSPNRMDALVWLITDLLLGDQKPPLIAR